MQLNFIHFNRCLIDSIHTFVVLGRITNSFSGSGLQDSWSWNSSNFHADDVMDEMYTDSNHIAIYSLNDFPQDQVEVSYRQQFWTVDFWRIIAKYMEFNIF